MIKRTLWTPGLEHPDLPGVGYEIEWDRSLPAEERVHTLIRAGRVGVITNTRIVGFAQLSAADIAGIDPRSIIAALNGLVAGQKVEQTFEVTTSLPGVVESLPDGVGDVAYANALEIHHHMLGVVIPALMDALPESEKVQTLNAKGEVIGEELIVMPTFYISKSGELAMMVGDPPDDAPDQVKEAWSSWSPVSEASVVVAVDTVAVNNADRAATLAARAATKADSIKAG